jgi:hypothetical protein
VTYEELADSRLVALLRYAVMLTGDPHLDLVQVVSELKSVEAVGLGLPVSPPPGQG